MAQVEARLTLAVETRPVSNPEELLALVDLVQTGPLDLSQMATLDRLSAGILALTGQGILVNMEDVKVPTAAP